MIRLKLRLQFFGAEVSCGRSVQLPLVPCLYVVWDRGSWFSRLGGVWYGLRGSNWTNKVIRTLECDSDIRYSTVQPLVLA